MRKVIIYVASSLNGFIAKPDGDVDWLHNIPNPDKLDYGYADFYESIDTTLMGNKTYQKVLSFGIDFPYTGKANYVFTRNNELKKDENVQFISSGITDFVKRLKNENGKDIWLIGGGEINSLLLNAGLVDELRLFLMPYIFGKGVTLFGDELEGMEMILDRQKAYSNNVLECIYKFRDR